MSQQQWDPAQYHKFREQRTLPFFDLVALIRAKPGMRAIDLGCGTAELSGLLADRLGAEVRAIDSSQAMLDKAPPHPRVTLALEDIAAVDDFARYDLVFSHAALHWVPDNERLMARMLSSLPPGAQVAVQVPRNGDHPSHRIAAELAASPRFAGPLGGFVGRSHALALDRYAELLFAHGFREQVCLEKIYGHVLPHTADVVEWVKGTLLTQYLTRLAGADRDAFLDEYRARLVGALGDQRPYFYPFRRLLFWGEKAT